MSIGVCLLSVTVVFGDTMRKSSNQAKKQTSKVPNNMVYTLLKHNKPPELVDTAYVMESVVSLEGPTIRNSG
jgi:hypothetical protein